MHTTWANDPVNSPNHYTRSHPGMECIELTADTSFCLGNAIKYLWRYHSKGRPVEDLEKADGTSATSSTTTRRSHGHAILDTLANDPAIPDAEAHTWAKLRQGFPYSASPASTASSNTKGTNNEHTPLLRPIRHSDRHQRTGGVE